MAVFHSVVMLLSHQRSMLLERHGQGQTKTTESPRPRRTTTNAGRHTPNFARQTLCAWLFCAQSCATGLLLRTHRYYAAWLQRRHASAQHHLRVAPDIAGSDDGLSSSSGRLVEVTTGADFRTPFHDLMALRHHSWSCPVMRHLRRRGCLALRQQNKDKET